MRISNTQPIQNLSFKEQDVPTKTSPQNLHGEEGTHLQENPDSSTIRRNHPKLSIIKTDKTGPQNWSPLAKLALVTAGVIKATALGYLAYTYNSNAPEAPSTNGKPINIPVPNPDTPTIHYVPHDTLNQESISNSSLPLVITAGAICLIIGGIIGSLTSKGKTDDSSFQKNTLIIPPNVQEVKDLENLIGQLNTEKTKLVNQQNDILANISLVKDQQRQQEEIKNKNLVKLNDKINTLTKNKTEIENEIRDLQLKKAEAGRQDPSLQSDLDTQRLRLNGEIISAKQELEKVQRQKQQLDEELNAKKENLKQEVQELENNCHQKKSELKKQLIELEDTLATKKRECDQEIEKLEKSTSQTKSEIENEIQQKIKALNEDLKARQIEGDKEIQERKDGIQSEIARLENELKHSTLELEVALETKRRECDQEISELEKSTSQKKSEIESEIERQIQFLNTDLEAKQAQYDQEIKELVEVTSQKKHELQEDLKNSSRELDEELKAKKQKIIDETNEILESEKKKRDEYIKVSQIIIQATEQRRKALEQQLTQLEAKTKEVVNSLNKSQPQLEIVNQELEKINLQLKEKKQELQTLIETQQRQAQTPKNKKPIKTETKKEPITIARGSSNNPVKSDIKTEIEAAKAQYDKLVAGIKEAKRARVKDEQRYNATSKENYKKELSALTTLLIELSKSEQVEIQTLIYSGFKELLNYSTREAATFAVACLDSDRMGCQKVASKAFTDLIHKYKEVKSKYEEGKQQNIVDPVLSRYPSEVLKKAIQFARQCKKKEKINLAIDSINRLDLATLKDIFLILFTNEPHSAIKFIDIFLDVLAKFETDKNKSFEVFIGTELQKRNPRIYNSYLAALYERNAFNPKEIVKFLSKPTKSGIEIKAPYRGKTTKEVRRSLKNPKNLPVVSKDVAFDDRSWLLPKNPRPKKPSIPSNVPSIGSSNVFSNPPPQRQITDSDNPWMSSLGNLGTSSLTQSLEEVSNYETPAYQIGRDDPLNQSTFFPTDEDEERAKETLPEGGSTSSSNSLWNSFLG